MNRVVGFVELDENENFLSSLGQQNTTDGGAVLFYPPHCGCFQIHASVKGLGNGWWVIQRLNDQGGLTIEEGGDIIACFNSNTEAQDRVYYNYWQASY